MKINKMRIAFVLILILSLSLMACVDQTVKYQQDARLLSLKIGDVEVPLIPRPISDAQWNSGTFGLAGADFGRASFNSVADTTEKRIIAAVNPGSRAEWGIATRGTRPGFFNDIRVPATFSDQDYIYIKVNSDDNETVNYYRVYTRLKAYVTDLNTISINGREGKAKGGETAWDKPELSASDISITVHEAEGALIEAVTFDPNAAVEYAFVEKDSSDEPVFSAPDKPLALKDQGNLYVKVIAENTIDKAYFKFRVDVGRMATIKTLKFTGGPKGDKEVFGKGLPAGIWNAVTAGSFSTAKNDQPNGGFKVFIEPDDEAAQFFYVKYASNAAGDPSFPVAPPSKDQQIEFASGDSLAIMVKSVNGGTNYYKVRVTLLAGNITKHPASAWYMKGAAAKELTVELDPPDSGQYTYQWYEADSWYGLYGRHGLGVDEKGNVSCVNGGPNQYFYLVEPFEAGKPPNMSTANENFAWKLDGATGRTYKPSTDWEDAGPHNATSNQRPAIEYPYTSRKVYYLAGSTNETRYYWAEVTDKNTGLKVVSNRAVILTETDPKAKHFIFDLSLVERKNLVPFVKLRELYQIDLRNYPFPAGFDPSAYEICIAHARYFLPDGRPWTQNWTHGDLHFGYTQGSDSFKKNGGSLTWWHNNLGANSGSVPLQAPHSSQGGLLYKPDWVGVAPSGDPAKGLPSPDPATGELPFGIYGGEAWPAKEAQGFFAGFIELLELRFQNAPAK